MLDKDGKVVDVLISSLEYGQVTSGNLLLQGGELIGVFFRPITFFGSGLL